MRLLPAPPQTCGRLVATSVNAIAVLAWQATRFTVLALLVTLEPVARMLLTVLTVLLLGTAGLFASARPATVGPWTLVAAACACALLLLLWHAAIAVLRGPRARGP